MPGVIKEQWGKIKYLRFGLKNMGKFIVLKKYMSIPISQYAEKWKSPRMRELFSAVMPGDWSVLGMIFGLALQDQHFAGYPVGGSLTFARNIERTYLQLGGKIRYKAKVKEIIVENGTAAGIRLENGEEVRGDYVISAADGHTTLFSMLGGNYLPEKVKKAYETFPLFPSTVYIGLGIRRDLSELPRSSAIYLNEPILFPDGSEQKYLNVTLYHYDPTFAPAGKTAAVVLFNTWKGDFWEKFACEKPEEYAKAKQEIAEKAIDALDKHFGNIRSTVEIVDVSTPHSVIRYTGNWQGSYEGFAPTPATFGARIPKTLRGLKNFFMIGQWTTPGGGLPPAGQDGRNIAMKICKMDKKKFSGR